MTHPSGSEPRAPILHDVAKHVVNGAVAGGMITPAEAEAALEEIVEHFEKEHAAPTDPAKRYNEALS